MIGIASEFELRIIQYLVFFIHRGGTCDGVDAGKLGPCDPDIIVTVWVDISYQGRI